MGSAASVFVAEGNVEVYLSKLHNTFDVEERETLLRLLADEQIQMSSNREHVENGHRRVVDGRQRIAAQLEVLDALNGQSTLESKAFLERALFMLETLER